MSSQHKKPGLFGRMFGGKAENKAPVEHNDTETAGLPGSADSGVDGSTDEGAAGARGGEADTAPDAVSVQVNSVETDNPTTATEVSALSTNAKAVQQSVAPDLRPSDRSTNEDSLAADPGEQGDDKPKSWFSRLKSGLGKTSARLSSGITGVFTKRKLDGDTIEELEDLLIQADLGVDTALSITESLTKSRYDKNISTQDVLDVMIQEIVRVLQPVAIPLEISTANKPHVILFVGVNGTGKTTTIGKMADKFTKEGKKVMLAAGDTFRAAAIDQLKIWGERTGARVVSRAVGSDASGLAYDAINEARNEGYDVLLIDTAGRLQNKQNLMDELAKLHRVIGKVQPDAPHDVLLVLDATTGQNALSQVEVFRQIAGVSGLVMTKLDGTARGGILVAIAAKYGLPIHAIGVGEAINDLQPFDATEFAQAIAAN